mgnify:CR=1 FL=1
MPQKPDTIARSLAIGNPADGYYALKATADLQYPTRLITEARAGRLVMFPAWLLHQVRPYRGRAERVSIALNLGV